MAVFTNDEFAEKKAVKKVRTSAKKEIKSEGGSNNAPAPVKNTVTMNFPPAPAGKSSAAFYSIDGIEKQVDLIDGNIEVSPDEVREYLMVGFVNADAPKLPVPKKTTRTIFVLAHPDNTDTSGYDGVYKEAGREFKLENGVIHIPDEEGKNILLSKGFRFIREFEEEIQ